jgi:NAD(P)-dependent dehydrogenase (short-subunit alcohol dehydrogenase family)
MTQQQTALIIGASRGLGAGLVRELAGRGWDVVGTQRTPSAELAAAGASSIETVDIDDKGSVRLLPSWRTAHLIWSISTPE